MKASLSKILRRISAAAICAAAALNFAAVSADVTPQPSPSVSAEVTPDVSPQPSADVTSRPSADTTKDASTDTIGENMSRMEKICNAPDFRLYREAPAENRYFRGGKFEPGSGIYHGTPFDVPYDSFSNALDTEYIWFDQSLTNASGYERADIAPYSERTGKLHLYNWNCAFKDKEMDPEDYSNYIMNTIDNMSISGDDVLLVFAKEFNINDNFTHPENFKELFRYVADYAHTKDNIAVVWPPNNVGSVNIKLIDYYPGDEYVDWIGMSLYVMPYFQGDPLQTNYANSVSFVAGDYSNAVIGAKALIDYMDGYGVKKPYVITEGSVGFGETPGRPEYKDGKEFVDWAQQQLKRYYYELPRVFPEIKIYINFNRNVDSDYYKYRLVNVLELSQAVKQAVSKPPFLLEYPSYSPIEYVDISGEREIDIAGGESLNISAYAYEPKALYLMTRYLIDGENVFESCYPPYSFTLSGENLSRGKHKLTAQKLSGGVVLDSKEFDVTYAQTVRVVLDGEEMEFEKPPVIENDRTLVPMRAIFEALGCDVLWDDADKTVTALKSGDSVTLEIGSDVMTKNGKEIILDAPAKLIDDVTFVPLRAVSEALDRAVSWDEATGTVTIE